MLMLSHKQAKLSTDRLEGVAEHAVADIVQKRGSERHLRLVFLVLTSTYFDVPLNDLHERTSNVEYPETMGEAGMGGSGENEL
jgi:hypothetical protein